MKTKVLAVLFALLACPAASQDFDPKIAEACLSAGRQAMQGGRSVNDGLAACVGDAAQACENLSASPTTLDMNACRAAEAAWWDDRLNEVYGDLRQLVEARDETRTQGLRDMQRAWIAWRDAACAFEAGEYAGGTLAGTVAASCMMQRTGDQVLWLAGELDRMVRQ